MQSDCSRNKTALEQEQEVSSSHYNSDRMAIEYSNPQLQAQSYLEISETERLLMNETVYYTGAAYQRIIDTFEDCVWVIRSDQGNLGNAFILLDGIIQNAYLQFQYSAKRLPEKLQPAFQQVLENMKKDSQKYYSQLLKDSQEILQTHFDRLEALLRLEKIETPACPKVTSIDPEKILPLFTTMQNRYTEQDKDLKRINEELTCITIPDFNSGSNLSSDFSLK